MSDATSRTATKRAAPSLDAARISVSLTSVHKVEADGVQVFYRTAGEANRPAILLLHGFPSSSFMFRTHSAPSGRLPRDRARPSRFRIH